MKIISWNVNGIRACHSKGLVEFYESKKPDILCLQEVKAKESQSPLELEGYDRLWNASTKAGYAGTAVYTREPYIFFERNLPIHEDSHGRVTLVEYDKFILANVYAPNSQNGLVRLDYRSEWQVKFAETLSHLKEIKPIIICGDLNVAHKDIDVFNTKSCDGMPGCSFKERLMMDGLLSLGFTDVFRARNPDLVSYTWWSYMYKARQYNNGLRLDYFLVSNVLMEKITGIHHYEDVLGSDHCPIGLEIDI